ncbi:MAG: ABC transporter ATP-binding protein [Firmicutes bacterium]|jgi:putative ABC transport system ATP-binding protein|nr:ABC transporter ATP-binding protein [Bacillota bacterium]
MDQFIELERLSKSYRMAGEELQILHQISLSVPSGQYLSVIGPSGSGKSTLMHILGCLDVPSQGRYVLDGRDLTGLSEAALSQVRRQSIGFIFQSFNLLPSLNAVENVSLPLMYQGIPVTQQKERAEAALERVGLRERRHHRPHQLSGGQQQRVAIARALVADAPLILADEPTGNLDSHSGEEILDLFAELNAEGRTFLVITHDPAVASRSQRIVAIHDGTVVEDRKVTA